MCAVPNMAVFCSTFTSCFPGMLLTYFLNDFEIVPVAPIVTGITFVFTIHMRCISIVRSLHFRIFSTSCLITFLSPQIATSINIHVPFSLSRIIMYDFLLFGLVLSVCTCWFHNMVTLPPALVSTNFATCSYQCFCLTVPLFPCICWSVAVHTLSHVFLCTVLLPIFGLLILCGLLSHQIFDKLFIIIIIITWFRAFYTHVPETHMFLWYVTLPLFCNYILWYM